MEVFERDVDAFHRELEASDDRTQTFGARLDWPEALALPAHARFASRLTSAASGPGGWLVGLWGLGALAVALGWLAALLAARRVVAAAAVEADGEWNVLAERARRLAGLAAPVRLLRSDALDVPVAWGWGGGAVVLPAGADAWHEDRREAVLLHEMAHLARRDAWSQAVAQAALAVHWANPVAWWAYRRFLAAREHACDDAVLRGGARPSAYAEHLVGVARAVRRDRAALAALAPMARTTPIESRVLSVLDPARRRRPLGRRAALGLAALAAAVCAPLAAVQPVAQSPAPGHAMAVAPADTLDPAEATAHAPEPPWDDVDRAVADATRARSLRSADGAADDGPVVAGGPAEHDAHRAGGPALSPDRGVLGLAAADPAAIVDPAVIEAALAEADRDLAEARAEIRERIEEVRRDGGVAAGLRLEALRQAEQSLAQIDRQSLRDQALRALGRDVGAPPVPPVPPAPPVPAVAPPTPPGVDWTAVDRARQAATERRRSH